MRTMNSSEVKTVSGGFEVASGGWGDFGGGGDWAGDWFDSYSDTPSWDTFFSAGGGLSEAEINKGCADLATKAWDQCKATFACRTITDEQTVKSTVFNECRKSFGLP